MWIEKSGRHSVLYYESSAGFFVFAYHQQLSNSTCSVLILLDQSEKGSNSESFQLTVMIVFEPKLKLSVQKLHIL